MTDKELSDAIAATFSMCNTSNVHSTGAEIVTFEHLKALLAIQLERAKVPHSEMPSEWRAKQFE